MLKLPIELQTMLSAAIGYLITEGLKSLSQLIGKDLSGAAAAITAALASALVLFAETLLTAVPEQYAGTVQAGLALLVAFLSAVGIHRQIKRFAK